MGTFVRLSHYSAISAEATPATAAPGGNTLGSEPAQKILIPLGEWKGQEGVQMPTMRPGTHGL